MRSLFVVGFGLCLPGLVSSLSLAQSAEESILVTAARVPVPAEDATASITVLDEALLEARGSVFLADALRAAPGLAVSKSGPAGALTQIRARGSEANHVLVLIDGIEAANPFTGEAEFAHLVLDPSSSVEISRGEQSALWGADAVGGVVRVISARPESGTQVSGRLETGSFSTHRASGRIATGFEQGWFSATASVVETDGIDTSGLNGEADGYENRNLSAAGGWSFSDQLRAEATLRWIDSESASDADTDFDGRLNDTAHRMTSERYLGRVALLADHEAAGVDWSHELAFHLTDDESVSFSPSSAQTRSLGQRQQAFYELTAQWQTGAAEHRLTGLIEHEQDRLKSAAAPGAGSNQSREIETTAFAADYGFGLGAFDLTASARRSENELFDDATTWRLGAGWQIESVDGRIHAAIGEAVKNPGIFELFGYFPDFWAGNPDLQPEQSQGWEIGWTQGFGEGRGQWSAVYFQSDLEDEIYL